MSGFAWLVNDTPYWKAPELTGAGVEEKAG